MSRDRTFDVAEAIHAAAIRVLRLVRVEDAKSEIGPAQLSALSVLVFAGEKAKTLRDLAALEQVKPPTMSRIVQALVEQGLAERTASQSDRRSVQVAVTAKGRQLLLAGRDRRVRALAKRLATLDRRDLETLRRAAALLSEL